MRDVFTKLGILFDHLTDTFNSWRRVIWQQDLDRRYCCDGRECGCMGATIRDIYCMKSDSASGSARDA